MGHLDKNEPFEIIKKENEKLWLELVEAERHKAILGIERYNLVLENQKLIAKIMQPPTFKKALKEKIRTILLKNASIGAIARRIKRFIMQL